MFTTNINSLALPELTDMLVKHTIDLLNVMDQKGANFFVLNDMCRELKSIQTAIDDQNSLLLYVVQTRNL
jgi:hypothetical protein